MPRIDIRDIDEDDINWIKDKCERLGNISRSGYIRLLINYDKQNDIIIKKEERDDSCFKKCL